MVMSARCGLVVLLFIRDCYSPSEHSFLLLLFWLVRASVCGRAFRVVVCSEYYVHEQLAISSVI